MKPTLRLRNLLLGSAFLAAAPLANAADYYFDTDGTTEGFGSADKSVSADPVWSTSSAGTATPATYGTANAGAAIAQTDNLYFGTSDYNYSGTINGTFSKRITSGNFLFGGSGTIIVTSGMEIASQWGNGLKSSISGSGSVTLNGVISGNAGSITQSGSGILTLSNTANTFGLSTAGATDNVITISGGGTIKVAKLAIGGATSSLGDSTKIDATRLKFNDGTLIHTGAQASTTNRDFTIQSGGATIKNDSVSSDNTLTWTGTAAAYGTVDEARSLTLGGSNTGANTFSGILTDNGELGALSLTKSGDGQWLLGGANSYSGTTTISGGTLALGTDNVLPDDSNVSIGAATLDASTFDDTAGTLEVTDSATIHLGAGANLVFADSSGVPWSGTLNLTGTFFSGSSLRFGDGTGTGLTSGQLSAITAVGFSNFSLNESGFLIADGGSNTAPVISDITDQSIPVDTATGALAFTVIDEDPASVLTSGGSDNLSLVPVENIVFGGSGANRTVTVTPLAGQTGTATITVTLTDNGSLTAQDTFVLIVNAASNDYLSWANSQDPVVAGGADGDSDNDGVKNLVEYALVDGGERGVLSGNTITFTKRGAPYGSDLTYIIETSETLASGSWTDAVTHTPAQLGSPISYTFTPSTPVKEFARLKVVTVP